MKYNKSIYAQRGFYALLDGGIYALSECLTAISCVLFRIPHSEFTRQFREPIIRVIENKGWRKAMANHVLAWNLAAETA